MTALVVACGGATTARTAPAAGAAPTMLATPSEAPAATPAAPLNTRMLVDLHSLADLQQRFDADAGTARLVLLVAPT